MLTVADTDVDRAVERRRYWAVVLGIVGLPICPVGLLLPAFALYEAHQLEAMRGMRVSSADGAVLVTVGTATDRLRLSSVSAARVRDLVVLSGETEAGRKYWNIPVGADDRSAVAALAEVGITVPPRQATSGREIAGILVFVVVDRGLAMVAGFAVLGAVLAFIGAALGETSVLWGFGGLGAAFGVLVLRALMRAPWDQSSLRGARRTAPRDE